MWVARSHGELSHPKDRFIWRVLEIALPPQPELRAPFFEFFWRRTYLDGSIY